MRARTKAEFEQDIVIQHPGFSNPIAIQNESFRIEQKVENAMRGGWSKEEAIQNLRDKGDPDF